MFVFCLKIAGTLNNHKLWGIPYLDEGRGCGTTDNTVQPFVDDVEVVLQPGGSKMSLPYNCGKPNFNDTICMYDMSSGKKLSSKKKKKRK